MSKAKVKPFWLAITAILLIAVFFRFYRIGDHPLGIFFDPAINGLDAIRLMQRGGHVLFFPTNGGREALFIYLLIPFIWLFDTTPFAMRLLTATISLLTVCLLFAMLRQLRIANCELRTANCEPHSATLRGLSLRTAGTNKESLPTYGTLLASLAALVLATMYWHISVSRLGQRPVLVPLLAVPLFWLFLKGWLDGRARWFIAAGVLLGLAVGYTYAAARLLPVILLLAVLPEFFLGKQRVGSRGLREAGTYGKQRARSKKQEAGSEHEEVKKIQPMGYSKLKTQNLKLNFYSSLITHHSSLITHLKNLLLLTAAALLVYAPMGWYFATHPAQFSARAGSVMVWNFLDSPAAIAAEIGRNAVRVAGFFCCAGSPNPIFGPPGQPGLSIWLAPFLVAGLVIALKNWRSLFHRLVALWWLIGIAPSIIAIEAPHPLRMIVALPPTAILVALGLIRVQLSIINYQLSKDPARASRFTFHVSRFTFYLFPLLLVLLPLPSLYSAYFTHWTTRQDVRGIYDYGAVAIRDAVLTQAEAQPDAPIYLPLSRFGDSTLLYYLGGHFERRAAVTVEPAAQSIVIAPDKARDETSWIRLRHGTATILPPLNDRGRQLIQAALSGPAAASIPIPHSSSETAARLAPLPGDPALFTQGLTTLLDATFGPIRLVGAHYPFAVPASEPLPVTLFWQAAQATPLEYQVLLRLVDDQRRVWGNGDARPTGWAYPTSFWQPGQDTVAAQQPLAIGPDAPPPGRYWLAVSLYDSALGQRRPLTAGSSDSPDTFYVGPLKVPLPHDPAQSPLAPDEAHAVFDSTIRLLDLALDRTEAAPGQSLQLELVWQVDTRPAQDYTIFIHLLDEASQQVVGWDSQPLDNRYPTSIWSFGEQILDRHVLPLPPELAAGQYRLALGLYHQPSGQRLPITLPSGQPASDNRLVLPQGISVSP